MPQEDHARDCHDVEQLLTVEELAAYLKVQPGWIYKACERQGLPVIKVGHYSRFLLSEVMKHLRQQDRNAR